MLVPHGHAHCGVALNDAFMYAYSHACHGRCNLQQEACSSRPLLSAGVSLQGPSKLETDMWHVKAACQLLKSLSVPSNQNAHSKAG